jgi:sec-independent protein translocase protein TatA
MFGLGPVEIMIVLAIGVLLFGNRLPEVGRSLGKGLMEFKKGLNDIKSEVDAAAYSQSSTSSRVAQKHAPEDREEPTAPKFEPPAQEPTPTAPSAESPTAQA